MITPVSFAYQSPEIVESFDAADVLGFADGFECWTVGNGSQVPTISVVA